MLAALTPIRGARRRSATTTRRRCAVRRRRRRDRRPRRPPTRQIADYALVVTSPGFQPDHAGAGRRRGGGRADLGRRGVGLAAGRRGPLRAAAALAGGHRHQRQDHHDVDAARDVDRRRPAQRAVRQHRQPGARRAGPAGRAAGRRAVQLPAALGAVAAARGRAWCSTSPRTTWTGTARWRTTPRPRPGCWTAGWRSSGWTTRARRRCWTRAGAGAGRVPARRARPPASSACATASWSTARSPTTWRCCRPRRSRSGPGRRARRAGRGGAGPQRRGGA